MSSGLYDEALRYERLGAPSPSDENRYVGQVDRDRILSSYSFRRLLGVTQIATASEHSLFHNRLTHSLEVAQIARRIAENLIRYDTSALHRNTSSTASKFHNLENYILDCDSDEPLPASRFLDPDVVEAASLAHDLGHPPFGHIGEKTLNTLIGNDGDGYEGNAQSLRIVTRLAQRRPGEAGLNLCQATLNAILKYPWTRTGLIESGKFSEKISNPKFGVYSSEEDTFRNIRGIDGDREEKELHPKTLEAEIMDYADMVAYAINDLNDFVLAGFITQRDIDGLEIDEIKHWYEKQLQLHDPEKILDKTKTRNDAVIAHEFLKRIVVSPQTGTHPGFRVHYLSDINKPSEKKSLTKYFVQEVQIDLGNPEKPKIKTKNDATQVILQVLTKLISKNIHESPKLLSQQHGQEKVLRFLFEEYVEIIHKKKNSLIPIQFKSRLEDCYDDNVQRKRLAADIVSSLTDAHAYKMYQRLSGVNPGAITDLIML